MFLWKDNLIISYRMNLWTVMENVYRDMLIFFI